MANKSTIRDDITGVLWPEIVARNPGIIAAMGFTNLRPHKINPSTGAKLSDAEYEQQKAACKANGKDYTKWKGTVVTGIGNIILKGYFGSSLTGDAKQEFMALAANNTDGKAAARIRGKFRARIQRWWDVNRGNVIRQLLKSFEGGVAQSSALLREYATYGGPMKGWDATPMM